MPRPKAFDRDDALHKAMDLFWSKGFEATSLQDLVDHMGIGRSSLYDTFGSKLALWSESMDLYAKQFHSEVLSPLAGPGSPRGLLTDFFGNICQMWAAGTEPSCLLVKALVTTGERCEETAAQARACLKEVEELLFRLMQRGIEEGEISVDKNPRQLAQFFLSSINGLGVSAALDRNHDRLTGISQLALAALD